MAREDVVEVAAAAAVVVEQNASTTSHTRSRLIELPG